MKKRLLTPLISAGLLFAAAVVTAQNQPPYRPDADRPTDVKTEPSPSASTLQGTVSQIDQNGRSFVVRDTSGTEVTIYWDQTTRLMGAETNQGSTTDRSGQTASNMAGLKIGDEVTVNTTGQGDKKIAATVKVRPKKSS